MQLDLSDEQQMLADTAERFFGEGGTIDEARRVGSGWSQALWRQASEIGFVTMRVPEVGGGADAGLMDAVLVCEVAGRAIAPIPLADSIAAARLAAALGEPGAALLRALPDLPIAFSPRDGVALLEMDDDRLTCRNPDGAVETIGSGADVLRRFEAARNEAALLRAAWLVGAATRALELAAAYARERKQFGRLIGSFQGVAFPLADSATDIEAARLAVWRAVWAIAGGREDAGSALAMAEWWAATVSRVAARRALRTFGGYGLTVEYDIHLYFLAIDREALATGDPAERLDAVARRLFGGAQAVLPEAGDPGIDLGLGVSAEALGAEVRAFFAEEPSADKPAGDHNPGLYRRLADVGLLFPDWPAAWGGQGCGAMAMTALGRVFEANHRDRVPIECTNMGARMVMAFGTPELQAEVLPRIARGEALSCLGFSEPDSGSDMYAARTRAVRDGDEWVITGQKMFTTGAHNADYVLLIARTDLDKPKHRGITVFYVPMSLPGVSIQPVHTLERKRTNITFYDAVRVPDRYRLGEVDGGLQVMAAAMQIEHGGEGYHVHHHGLLQAALEWARTPDAAGHPPIDDARVRTRLARVATHLALGDLLCRRASWAGDAGKRSRATGPMAKMFATEKMVEDAADLVALTAAREMTPALARIEQTYRVSIGQTIYGGTSEIHRGIIAEHALGLPKSL